MPQQDLIAYLEEIGALKSGHFEFASGRHGDVYLEKFDLLRNPAATVEVCSRFASEYRDAGVDVVVGPTTGGVILAFETARQLGVAAAYAERASEGGDAREVRRGTTFSSGTRVLVVDDILTTGGSARETLKALAPHDVEVVAVAILVDRSGGAISFGDVPLFALASQAMESWAPEDCPMCQAGQPLEKPGTTAKATDGRVSG